jgi:hypothetical protein
MIMKKKRMSNMERRIRRFVRNLDRTWKNKICAIALICAGMISMMIDGDATALVLMLIIGIPLFFTEKEFVF